MTKAKRAEGFTLIELLLVIAIIGTLIALLLPAIQSSRETARRLQCSKNLMQIGLALGNYASSHRVFPPGVVNDKGPISNLPLGYHFGWAVHILPYLEHAANYRAFDFQQSVYAPRNDTARNHQLNDYLCPSDARLGLMSYAACHHDVEAPIAADNHGVFFLNSRVSLSDLTDGPACTILVGEFGRGGPHLGWAVGTSSSLRNTGTPVNTPDAPPSRPPGGPSGTDGITPGNIEIMINEGSISETFVGGFRSFHPGGANFLFGDGSVRFLTDRIQKHVYQALAHRNDGSLISDDEY